jgi:hypothetical protein
MHSSLATTDHTRGNWPFPPAPPTKLLLRRATFLRVVPASTMLKQAWPDLAGPNLAGPNLAGPNLAGPNLAGPESKTIAGAGEQFLSKRQMIGDICLVAMWGAMIPGLLWLGHAVGY